MAETGAIPPEHPRFFCRDLPHPRVGDPHCRLDADQARHLRKVLRARVGDPVELFDGAGGLATARIDHLDRDHVRCRVQAAHWHERGRPWLTVATAMPKGPRGETMIEQLSQLGVDRVAALRTQRSVVHPRPQKRERFEKAAIESAKQSGRLFLMEMTDTQPLQDAAGEPADVKLALAPRGQLQEPERDRLRAASHVLLFIGPEGGFAEDELQTLQQSGAEPWTLSPTVLRIETAAVTAAGLARFMALR